MQFNYDYYIFLLSEKINIYMSFEFMNSKMYLFLKLEKQEIDKLKWIESEKLGRDIGKHKAVFLWSRYHRKAWYTKMESLCS